MQRYQWPGYELQLLAELQRQQNSAQYCDTLLQTEGISVPTHSCVLAALSPYFSQQLSATPSPPRGQKRHLQLRALKAQTLLKLVGLLYSGQLEVKGPREQNDVLAAAHRLGLAELVEGRRHWRAKEEELQRRRERVECCWETEERSEEGRKKHQKTQKDAEVQVDLVDRRDKGCVSESTQTEDDAGKSVSTTTGNEELKSFTTPQSTSVLSNKLLTFADSVSDDCSSMSTPDGRKESTECEDCLLLSVSEDRLEEGGAEEDREGEREELPGRRAPPAGRKSLQSMKDMIQTAHISVKVKLRRRTAEEVWEVVHVPDVEESSSLQGSAEEDQFLVPPPQRSVEDVQPLSSSDRLYATQKPQIWTPPATFDPPERRQTDTSSSNHVPSQPRSETKSRTPPPPPPLEESDEQIEKLLEDIMMSLNILPCFDGRKSQTVETGFPYGFPAVNQPCCSALVSPPPQISTQQRDGTICSHQTPESLHPEGAAATSRSASLPSGHFDPRYPIPLSSLDELRLPECLSPLMPSLSAADYQLLPNNPEPQPLLRKPSWLAENPGSLQFPLSNESAGEAGSESETQNTNPSCGLSQENRNNEDSAAESHLEESNRKSDDREKCSEVPVKRKRICRSYFQTPTCCFSDCNGLNRVKKSICSVNLSTNNVLAVRREMDTRKLPEFHMTRRGNVSSDHSRVRTRSSVRRNLQMSRVRISERVEFTKRATTSMTTRGNDNDVLLRRKRGRPPKVKLTETLPEDSATETKSNDEERGEVKEAESLLKEEKKESRKRSKKRKRKKSEAEEIPLKKRLDVEEAKTDNNNNNSRNPDALQKPRMVTIKEIQKMLERRNSKTRKADNNQERQKSGEKTEGEAKEEEDVVEREERNHSEAVCSEESSLNKEEDYPEFHLQISDESGPPSTEGEETLQKDDGSEEICLEGSPPEDETDSEFKPNDQQRGEEGLDSNDAGGRTEEEEEEEVDILVCSPDKTPPIRRSDNVVQGGTEEEEEDEEEIDVIDE